MLEFKLIHISKRTHSERIIWAGMHSASFFHLRDLLEMALYNTVKPINVSINYADVWCFFVVNI